MLLSTVQGGEKIIQQGWDDHLVISKPCPHLAQAANLDIFLPHAFPHKNKSVRADGWEAGRHFSLRNSLRPRIPPPPPIRWIRKEEEDEGRLFFFAGWE